MSDLDNILFDLAYQEGKSVSECLYDVYEKGRADAIDEVKNKVIAWNMQSDDGWIPCGQVIEWLEQLKEKE